MNRPLNTTQIDPLARYPEWPTWLLIFVVYGSWVLVLANFSALGSLTACTLLVVIGAASMSMQHEILHGHPTRSTFFNALLAYPPLVLLFPYPVYRETHIIHHNDENITLPGIDPESFYVSKADWENSGSLRRAYLTFNMTVFGRLLCGPANSALALVRTLLADFAAGKPVRIAMWLVHLLLVSALLYGVNHYFQVPIWQYVLVAYFANSLAMVRSFFEHRAVESVKQRSILMEGGWFFRALFLNLNFHLVHHEYPALAWYKLPALYRDKRGEFIAENGHFVSNGYHNWLIGHLLKPIDSPVHPFAND